MSQSAEQIWIALRDAGLVQNEKRKPEISDTPWFVKTLLAFSGWLAAFFLFFFVAIEIEYLREEETVALIIGAVLIAVAFALLRTTPKSVFLEHLALAVSLAGQLLIALGVWKLVDDRGILVWLLMALFQAFLAVLMPNFLHRVFSTLISVLSLAAVLKLMGAFYLFSGLILLPLAWLWLNEFRFPEQLESIQAIGYGLVLALIPLTGVTARSISNLYGYSAQTPSPWVRPWMGELLAACVLGYVVWNLLQRHGQRLSGLLVVYVLVGTAVVGVVSMAAKGIGVGIVILLLGFAGGNRVLLGLGVASLLFYVLSYYATLETTLLAKAQTLLIVGLVLLVARWLLLRLPVVGSEKKHG